MLNLIHPDGWARSVRHALRTVRARPGLRAAVVLTLALGIGVTTAIFSVENGVLLRPLPFAEESRLVTICETYPGASNDWCSISPPNVADIAERSRTIEAIGIARSWSAQGAARQREMAPRSALGAAIGRIAAMLLVESATFAVLGAVGGLGMSELLLRAFRRLAPDGMPRVAQVTIDVRVALFAAALAAVTALLVGLVPAWRASRVDLAQSLRAGGRSGPSRRSRLGTALVVGELAMAVLLIAGAGTFARSFGRAMQWDPGFDREHLAIFSLSPSAATYRTRASLAALWDRLEGAIGAIPGVQGVGTASAGPLFGSRETWEMEIEGHPAEQRSTVRWSDVSPGYFATLGVPLRAGRALDARDRPGTPVVAVVNETLARRFWPNESPLGKHVVFPVGNDRQSFEVVGVVGVVGYVPPTVLGASPEPEMYWSNRQQPCPYTYVIMRTGTNRK